ncbi:uroporphyrinogen decarboxylase family protein [Geobacter sulfurreducens subsp. ethanolicus]|uniref:uroporphyrinogen decarboxylase family protein n=1 Tax=Geobacter sulfurreducens TaxID=35554 RepID=UPI0025729C5D|nr:uroporphyrinogen decarboxylase family protein [Geobacter sulfurreducens]BEH09656.1 uroporphyrinogen decarboxylase family protein [Geobacter sulfurreducens subsp. ethanolicus]
MTSFDRVMAAIGGGETDRPPFTLTLSLYGARLIGAPTEQYYTSPRLYAEGQRRVAEFFSPDILYAPFALAREAEAFGSTVVHHRHGPPNVVKPVVKNAADFMRLADPDPDGHPALLYLRESVRILADGYKGRVPLAGILTAPVDLPAIVMGIDAWLETLLFEPELASAVLEKTGRHFVAMATRLLEDGADFVAMPVMFFNTALVTSRIAVERIVPALAAAFAQVPGPLVFHHGGNRLAPFLGELAGLPGVAGFVIDPRDSFQEARARVGDGRVLLGKLNGPLLGLLTPDDACRVTAEILADRRDDRHFIFASSAADVPWNTPPETVAAVADTIRQWQRHGQ